MKTPFRAMSMLLTTLAITISASAEPPGAAKTWNFEADKVGGAPAGFAFGRTGSGHPARWIVQADQSDKDAPSGNNVLAQTDVDDTDYRFPVAFIGPEMKDLRLSVRCKPVSGKVDQGCGLVFRLKDQDNYYVARANALEDNVGLYHVVRGTRRQFAGWRGKVASGKWHELAIDAQGDHIQVFFDGNKVIEAQDKTFPAAGKFGVWTKADSLIYFDDLVATPK
jgi:hypothetical protein